MGIEWEWNERVEERSRQDRLGIIGDKVKEVKVTK